MSVNWFIIVGALAFGTVVGWVTYFILRRANPTALTDLATIVSTLGGAAILSLFDAKTKLFAAYSIGLAIGFFAYLFLYWRIVGKMAIRETLVRKQNDEGTVLE